MSRNEKNHSFIATIISLCVGLCVAITPAYANPTRTIQNSELVSVVIDENDERVLVADVPANKVEEYKELLKDETFRQAEIAMAEKPHTRKKRAAGDTVVYYGKEEILKVLDSYDKNTKWLQYISKPLTSAAKQAAKKLFKTHPVQTGLAAIGILAISSILTTHEKWWNDSAEMILNGQIRFVRLTLTPNTTGRYPAVWRKLDRIK